MVRCWCYLLIPTEEMDLFCFEDRFTVTKNTTRRKWEPWGEILLQETSKQGHHGWAAGVMHSSVWIENRDNMWKHCCRICNHNRFWCWPCWVALRCGTDLLLKRCAVSLSARVAPQPSPSATSIERATPQHSIGGRCNSCAAILKPDEVAENRIDGQKARESAIKPVDELAWYVLYHRKSAWMDDGGSGRA